MAFGSIAHHLAHVVLRVEAAIRQGVVGAGIQSEYLALACGSLGRQLRMALQLQPPSLVVGQVPMEVVEFVPRQEVDVTFDILHGEEVAHHVEVHAPVTEAGAVLYFKAGQFSAARGGNQLFERLKGIK